MDAQLKGILAQLVNYDVPPKPPGVQAETPNRFLTENSVQFYIEVRAVVFLSRIYPMLSSVPLNVAESDGRDGVLHGAFQ